MFEFLVGLILIVVAIPCGIALSFNVWIDVLDNYTEYKRRKEYWKK